MKYSIQNIGQQITFAFCLLTFALTSCGSLEKEVEIDLPEYESQLVVECYLEAGEPFTLLLTRSAAYFDPLPTETFDFVESILEDSAAISILHNGVEYQLENQLFFNPVTSKLYNYFTPELVPEDFDNDFQLTITTADGEVVTSSTRLLPAVPIDSNVVEFEPEVDTLARLLTYLSDDLTQSNYYRRTLHENSLDTLNYIDFTTVDDFFDDETFVFGTGFDFVEGDTLFTTVYHIDREYFDFLESVFFAQDANGNPFGQPAAINSNLTGDAIGIFTGLSYTREMVIVER